MGVTSLTWWAGRHVSENSFSRSSGVERVAVCVLVCGWMTDWRREVVVINDIVLGFDGYCVVVDACECYSVIHSNRIFLEPVV